MRNISVQSRLSRLTVLFPTAGLTVCFCALLIFLPRQTAQGDAAAELPDDPVPLRRVLLSPERVLPELERVKSGQLLRLPRAEFELRVKQAADAGEALKQPPRLVESRYRATLVDASLQGSAEWKIVNPCKGPGILTVEPLGIALRQVRWPDKREAVLGDLDGDGPRDLELLVEQPGERSLHLEWSARSTPVPGGLRFSLDVPPCAVATLDLEMPEDHELTASRDLFLVSGPHAAAAPNRRTWRVGFSGRSQVNLMVQFRGAGLPAPVVVSRQQTRQEITPGQLQADYDFDLEVLHSGVTELRCDCDPALRPHEVTIRNLEGWEVRGGKNGPSTLLIRLREPLRAGKLQVRCLAPLPGDKAWVSPNLRLANAVFRGETLLLRVHPEVRLEDWKPAGFRLTRSTFTADGWHELSLRAGLDAGANPERPSTRFQPPRCEYRVQQIGWWQVGPGQSALTAVLTYDVSRGRLFRLPVQLPAGWTVDHLELAPAGLLRDWTLVPEKGKPTLMVELHQALGAASAAVLTVQARPVNPAVVPTAGAVLPLPDLVPLDAPARSGGLGISVSPVYQPSVTASVPAASPDVLGESQTGESRPRPAGAARARPPWGKQLPDYYFPFQGQAVEGILSVRPRATRLRARCTSDVVLAAGRAAVLARLELAPEVGTPEHVDLFVFGPAPAQWEWQTVRGGNRVHSVERLLAREHAARMAALASRSPLQTVALAGMWPSEGSWWRLHLVRPLTEPVTLEATTELPGDGSPTRLAAGLLGLGGTHPLGSAALGAVRPVPSRPAKAGNRWRVPLVTVPAAERLDGRVTLHPTDRVRVTIAGLEEVNGTAPPDPARRFLPSASSRRTLRYALLPLGLELDGDPPARDRPTEAVIDRAQLTTYLEDGRLLQHYRFRVWYWRQQTVPLALPPRARLLAARADGRWLSRVVPGMAENGCSRVDLPVVTEGVLHRFDVIYAVELPPWSLWSQLEAPAPLPPVPSVALERTWCLPHDVAPANPARFQQLPAVDPEVSPILGLVRRSELPDSAVRQHELLAEAVSRLRKQFRPGEKVRFGRLVEALAFDQLKEQTPLVLDVRALHEAGLLPSTAGRMASGPCPEGALPWASLDVVCVSCRAVVLVTTQRQRSLWGGGVPFESDATQAAAFGHDPSGRFRTVPDWLAAAEGEPDDLPPVPDVRSLTELPAGMTAWKPLAGRARADQLIVVRPRGLPLIGLALGTFLGLAAFLLGKRLAERPARRLVLLWLAGGGLALLWLPAPWRPLAWWPALAGAAAALVWCVNQGWGRFTGVQRGSPSTVITGSFVLAGLVGLPGQAAAPGPTTVYLLPENDATIKSVLAPPALLDQLQALARRGAPGLSGAVLLGAAYEGRSDADTARFEARYAVHSFGDEPATVTLPLGGVQLTEAAVDGAPAHPAALRGPREGYALEVKGRGSHTVVLRFAVAVNRSSDDWELRFTVPELPRSRLTLEAPARAGFLHAAEARGSQRSETNAPKLEADLGAIGTVRVRWRRDANRPRPAVVQVREAYYWDLQASSARLLGILHYAVSKGWTSQLALDLPAAVEVVSVESGPAPGGPPAPRLKEWRLKKEGPGRRLLLEFQEPVTGEVQVTLELVPRQPFGRSAPLVFPTPLEAQAGRGFLAYHVAGLDARVDQYHAITGIDHKLTADTFAEAFGKPWRAARQEDLPAPTRAYWRGRDGNLRLALEAPPVQLRCRQELSWRVKPRQATLKASAQLASPDGLALVEWDVPGKLIITEITGPHVRRWARSGGRVQVWLQKPVAETTLQLTGWLPRSAQQSQRFDVPPVRIGTRPQSTTLRVAAGVGVALTPESARNLTPQREQSASGREWAYTTEAVDYGARFRTTPAAPGRFRLLTFAEVRNRQVTFVTTVKGRMPHADVRSLTVALRGWEGREVTLDAPDGVRRREQHLDGGGRSWALDLKPGVSDDYGFTLTASVPLAAATELFAPDVRVEVPGLGPVAQQRWVGVAGQELLGEAVAGVQAVTDFAELAEWQGERERLRRAGGQIWRITADDWRLRLRPRNPAARRPVDVLLAEHVLAVVDGKRWLHQATYRLYHEVGADLGVTLPHGAAVLAVAVDGTPVPPVQSANERLWLSVPGGAGFHTVRLSWVVAPGSEPIDSPSLDCPRLDGASAGPTVWTLHVPPGYELGRTWPARGSQSAIPASAAVLDLWRAAVQVRLLGKLRERNRDGTAHLPEAPAAAAQEEFERLCRQADYELGQPGAATVLGPSGQPAAIWLRELREEFSRLAHAGPRRPAAAAATGQPLVLAALESGRPLYWQAAGDAAPPRVALLPLADEENRRTLALSTLLLVLVLAVWILARFFRAGSWPEQLVVLGILGALLFGPVVGRLFVLLVPAGIGARSVQLLTWLRASRLTRKEEPPAAIAEG